MNFIQKISSWAKSRNQQPIEVTVPAVKKEPNWAAFNAQFAPQPISIAFPHIPRGVVPSGSKVAVHDSALPCYDPSIYGAMMGDSQFRRFPGFQVLAQMATQVEYMNLHRTFAEEITRKWGDILTSDAKNASKLERIKKITKEFEKYKVRELLYTLVLQDAVYGRAQYLVNLKGIEGPKLVLPLYTNDTLDDKTINVGQLIGFKAIEAWTSTPAFYNSTKPWEPDFYRPESWFVMGQQIHNTRIRTIASHELPDIIKPAFNFAGMSLSQLCQPYVENWIDVRTSTNRMLETYSMTAIATNMVAMMQDGTGGASLARRAQAVSLLKDNQGVILIDKDTEELILKNAPLSGLDKLQSQALEQVCAASRLPAVKYTGMSPLGLNASSEGEMQSFYDEIAANQDYPWLPEITFILKIIQLNMDGVIDDTIFFQFNPLFEHDDLDMAEIRKKESETNANYVNAGIVSEEEVREQLSLDDTSGFVGIDPSKVPEPKVDPAAMGPDGQPLKKSAPEGADKGAVQ